MRGNKKKTEINIFSDLGGHSKKIIPKKKRIDLYKNAILLQMKILSI